MRVVKHWPGELIRIVDDGDQGFKVQIDGEDASLAVLDFETANTIALAYRRDGLEKAPKRRRYSAKAEKTYSEHLMSDFNYDPGGDDSPDCGPSDG